jgi:hypothetical protein
VSWQILLPNQDTPGRGALSFRGRENLYPRESSHFSLIVVFCHPLLFRVSFILPHYFSFVFKSPSTHTSPIFKTVFMRKPLSEMSDDKDTIPVPSQESQPVLAPADQQHNEQLDAILEEVREIRCRTSNNNQCQYLWQCLFHHGPSPKRLIDDGILTSDA